MPAPQLPTLPDGELTHVEVEQALRQQGWRDAGQGDWAIALRSPEGTMAARISPFDPTGGYAAQLYREAAGTGQVPVLYLHRRLRGGGDLQLLEWLEPLAEASAAQFHRDLAAGTPSHAALAEVVRRVHDQARAELAWCGPLDDNPANVMLGADGRLVLIDPYYADGPRLYQTAFADPDQIVATIPADQREFIDQIPITSAGGWEPGSQQQLRDLLAAADARAAAARG